MHSPGRMKIAERRVAQWSKRGAPVELLSREETARRLGSDAWFGGWWNRTGGHINPLALVRGLARAVLGRRGRRSTRARPSPAMSTPATAGSYRRSAAGHAPAPWCWRPTPTPARRTHAGTRHRPRDRARALVADGDGAARRQRAPHHPARAPRHVRHPRRALFRPLRCPPPPGHRRRAGQSANGAERLKPYVADAPAAAVSQHRRRSSSTTSGTATSA